MVHSDRPAWSDVESRNVPEREPNLLDYCDVIIKRIRLIAAIVITASLGAVVVSLLLPEKYRSEAVLLPISNGRTSRGRMADFVEPSLGEIGKILGFQMGGSSDGTVLLSILKSRTLSERVIARENLMPILFTSSWNEAAGTWKSKDPRKAPQLEDGVRLLHSERMNFSFDATEPTVTISGLFSTPHISKRVVDAYILELQQFISSSMLTVSKRNRAFIQDQLAQNNAELLIAAKELDSFYEQNRVSSTDAKIDVLISGSKASKLLAADDSKQHTAASVGDLKRQKKEIEAKLSEMLIKDVPQQVYYEYLARRLEILNQLNALLTNQLKMAEIEEAKDEPAFQIIDPPNEPFRRATPKRMKLCVIVFGVSIIVAVVWVLFLEYLDQLRANRRSAVRA